MFCTTSVLEKCLYSCYCRFREFKTLFQNRSRAKHWFKNLPILVLNFYAYGIKTFKMISIKKIILKFFRREGDWFMKNKLLTKMSTYEVFRWKHWMVRWPWPLRDFHRQYFLLVTRMQRIMIYSSESFLKRKVLIRFRFKSCWDSRNQYSEDLEESSACTQSQRTLNMKTCNSGWVLLNL